MLNGSRSSRSIFGSCHDTLRIVAFNYRPLVTVILLFLSTCHIRGETLSPDLDLVYQQAHPAALLGLPDDDIRESGSSPVKRSSFMPMRGRRGPDGSYSDSIDDKRASAFLHSRGKKDQDDAASLDMDKRKSAFMAMRGRRMEAQQPLDGHFYDNAIDLDDEEPKRSSFMPMRGRKSSFMPMRGRKWSPDSEDKYYGLDTTELKRASFMPMRGRKKAFYSKGGKKRLNSFMPMRGKKDSAEDDEEINKSPNDARDDSAATTTDEEMVARALEAAIARGQVNLTSEDKRAASSFFGMRGKRNAPASADNPSMGTVKRGAPDALFFASRGKRSTDTKVDEAASSTNQVRQTGY